MSQIQKDDSLKSVKVMHIPITTYLVADNTTFLEKVFSDLQF